MSVNVQDALLSDTLYHCTVEMRVKYCQVFCIKAAVRNKHLVKAVQRITLRWYARVLRQDDDDWMQKCVTLESCYSGVWSLRESDKGVSPGEHGETLWTRM